jgi:hypothetical protein
MPTPPLKGIDFRRENSPFANLKTRAQDAPNLTLKVSEGAFWTSGKDFVEFGGGNSPTFTVPSASPKWSFLVLQDNGTLQIIDGAESSDPQFPVLPSGKLPLAAVYLLPTDSVISEDMLFDVRPEFHLSLNASSISASIAGFSSDIALLQASATAHHQSISVLNVSVADLETRVSAIEVSTSANLASQVNRIDNSVAVNASDIVILEASATAHHQSINLLNASVAALGLTTLANASSITVLQGSVTANASSITVLGASILSNASAIDTLQNNVSALDVSVLAHHQSISALNVSRAANSSAIVVLNASLVAHQAADVSNFAITNASVAANASAIVVLQSVSALSFPLQGPDGSSTEPSYSFASDPNTGMHRGVLPGRLDFVASGVTMLQMIASDPSLFAFGHIGGVTGSAAEPSFRFNNDQDTGMYLGATGVLSFAAAASQMLRIARASSVTVLAPLHILGDGSLTTPALSFPNDPDTGIAWGGTNSIAIVAGASARISTSAGGTTLHGSGNNAVHFDHAEGTFRPNVDKTGDLGASIFQWDQVWASAIRVSRIAGASILGWDITASGHLIPTTGSSQDLGSSALPVRDLYMSGSSLFMGGTQTLFKSAGNTKLEAAAGGAGTGFNVTIIAGSGNNGGDVLIRGGFGAFVETGGDVKLAGGDGAQTRGNIIASTIGQIRLHTPSGRIDASAASGIRLFTTSGDITIHASGGLGVSVFSASDINMVAETGIRASASEYIRLTAGSSAITLTAGDDINLLGGSSGTINILGGSTAGTGPNTRILIDAGTFADSESSPTIELRGGTNTAGGGVTANIAASTLSGVVRILSSSSIVNASGRERGRSCWNESHHPRWRRSFR